MNLYFCTFMLSVFGDVSSLYAQSLSTSKEAYRLVEEHLVDASSEEVFHLLKETVKELDIGWLLEKEMVDSLNNLGSSVRKRRLREKSTQR